MNDALCYYIIIILEGWISSLKHNVNSSILRWLLIHMCSPQGLTMLQIYFSLLNKDGINTTTKRISAKQTMYNFSWLASDFHDFNQEKWQLLTGVWKMTYFLLSYAIFRCLCYLSSLQHVSTHQGTSSNNSKRDLADLYRPITSISLGKLLQCPYCVASIFKDKITTKSSGLTRALEILIPSWK